LNPYTKFEKKGEKKKENTTTPVTKIDYKTKTTKKHKMGTYKTKKDETFFKRRARMASRSEVEEEEDWRRLRPAVLVVVVVEVVEQQRRTLVE
jgi:hypothetical protein